MYIIICLLISIIGSFAFCRFYVHQKSKQVSEIKNYKQCINSLSREKNELINRNDIIINEIEKHEITLDTINNELYTQSERLNIAEKEYKEQLNKIKINIYENHNKEIEKHLKDLEEDIANLMKKYNADLKNAEQVLKQQKASISAYIEEQKRKEEMLQKQDFYKMSLTDNEINDINKLLSLSSELSQPDILLKLIYKTYFEKKMNDLLGRVIGPNSDKSGIYKITNIELDKSYIGQCVSFKDRWRTHLKKGLGIDTPSTNKFYQAMKEFKPWNFTFEVLEFCPKEELNKKENYWINFYQTNTWGYNGNKGVEK